MGFEAEIKQTMCFQQATLISTVAEINLLFFCYESVFRKRLTVDARRVEQIPKNTHLRAYRIQKIKSSRSFRS